LPQVRTLHGVDRARDGERDAVAARSAGDGPASGEPLLDAERLAALRRVARGDENFLVRYLAASLHDLDAAMAHLRAAVPDGHVRQVKDALHAIEGTAASLGAESMLDGCRLLRERLVAGQHDGLSHAFAELSARYALTKSALRATVQLEGNSVSGASDDRRP
jgi:hypothetical protein